MANVHIAHHTHYHASAHAGEPAPSMGVEGVPSPFKVRALGSHVAVRDSPYPVVHSPCLAGVECRDRARSLRDQDPGRDRRVFAMGCLGSFTGCVRMGLELLGVHVVLVLRLALVHVVSTHLLPTRAAAYFWEFADQSSSVPMGAWEVRRWHSTLGMSQRAHKLDRSVRRPA